MSSTNSIFLPFVYDNLSEEYIKNIFESAGIGEVERIDFVSKAKLPSRIIMPSTCTSSAGVNLDRRHCWDFWAEIDKDGCPKLVYSDPWFWKCLKPRAKKHSGARMTPHASASSSDEGQSA